MSCCTSGLQEVFTEDTSRKEADRYRRRGLPRRARRLMRAIEAAVALRGRSTLEVGVGAGAVTVEMLRRGATHAIGIDAVPAQLASARWLAQQFDVADRAEFLGADFAAGMQVANADVVVLDRVVCCYSDWQSLLTSAAAHSNIVLALTYPRDAWWTHMMRRALNLSRRIMRKEYRFYVHPVSRMHDLLRSLGLQPQRVRRYFVWEIAIARRA